MLILNNKIFFIECFVKSSNRFEQFCINYANEKIQSFCTTRLITDEIKWYKTEGVEIPEISFPGNDMILGKFHQSNATSLILQKF